MEGVVEAYKNALQKLALYGPTKFSEILSLVNEFCEHARVRQTSQQYFILLIITDGIINDMRETIDEIVRGTGLPLSIIIVGVGGEDFEAMDVLDADEVPLYSQKLQK